MPHTLLARITYAIFAAICLFALWRGDRWQRLSSLVLLACTVITPFVQDRAHPMDPQARLLMLDAILMVYFGSLALFLGRAWMIVAAATQLLSTLSHPAAHLLSPLRPYAYLAILQLCSYGPYLALGFGTLTDSARRSGDLRRAQAPRD